MPETQKKYNFAEKYDNMENISNDIEARVRKILAEHRSTEGFPKVEDYGITEDDLDDYLFDKQAIIDDVDSLRKKYTIYSVIFIIPFLVVAFYETTARNALIATACGLVLCGIYYLITMLVRYIRLHSMTNKKIEEYIEAIMKYEGR